MRKVRKGEKCRQSNFHFFQSFSKFRIEERDLQKSPFLYIIVVYFRAVTKLKAEWIYPHGIYVTREAKLHIIEYIEIFYNSERVHQALDYCTPNELEAKYFQEFVKGEMVLTPVSR